MVFFATIAIIWMMGGELNIVIYTAIILALGMLVDDAVVVLENIERHLTELKEDLNTAIIVGTREVIAPVFAGTVATIAIMFPFLFAGDFPQQIYRPLISTLIIALLVSYFLSITFIPSISFLSLPQGQRQNRLRATARKALREYLRPSGGALSRHSALFRRRPFGLAARTDDRRGDRAAGRQPRKDHAGDRPRPDAAHGYRHHQGPCQVQRQRNRGCSRENAWLRF